MIRLLQHLLRPPHPSLQQVSIQANPKQFLEPILQLGIAQAHLPRNIRDDHMPVMMLVDQCPGSMQTRYIIFFQIHRTNEFRNAS